MVPVSHCQTSLTNIPAIVGPLLALVVASSAVSETHGKFVHQLHDYLLQDYNKDIRPVKRPEDAVFVAMETRLINILEFAETKQTLATAQVVILSWIDQFLTWDETQFNLSNTSIPSEKIWLPDIHLYNSAIEQSLISARTDVWVTSDGNITWIIPAQIVTSCKINVAKFPFDEQFCLMFFGSWIYTASHIFLTTRNERHDAYYRDTGDEWMLVEMYLTSRVFKYPCCPAPFTEVKAVVHIKRQSLFYTFNLAMPVSLMLVLTCVGFYVPCESGEKITLGITLFLSDTVFLIIVSNYLPPTSDTIPFLSQYFGLTIILQALSTLMNVIIVYSFEQGRDGMRVPWWLRSVVFGKVGRLMLQNHQRKLSKIYMKENCNLSKDKIMLPGCLDSGFGDEPLPADTEKTSEETSLHRESLEALKKIHFTVECIRTELRRREHEKQESRKTNTEWALVAVVVDRTCLVLFVLISLISLMGILL